MEDDWKTMHSSSVSTHKYRRGLEDNDGSDYDEDEEALPLKKMEHGKAAPSHSHKKKKKTKKHHDSHQENEDVPLTWRTCLRGLLSKEGIKILFILAVFFVTLFLFISDPTASFAEVPQKKLYGIQSDQPLIRIMKEELPLGVIELLGSLQYVKNQTQLGDLYVDFIVEVDKQGDGQWQQTTHHKMNVPVDTDTYFHDFINLDNNEEDASSVRLKVTTNSNKAIAIYLEVQQLYWFARYQVGIGIATLLLVYVLIIFEVIHRTIIALVGSFWCLAVIALVQHRQSFIEVINWIDFDTLGLLFGMMILVGIFSETGFFEFCAIKAYRLSKGKIWNLVFLLCGFTAVMSGFFGSVPTILLLTPVTIRLAKVIGIDPCPIVLAEVMMSNIGGGATAIGDPPNVIIVNDPKIVASGQVNFTNFIAHVAPGVVIAVLVALLYLRFALRNQIKSATGESRQQKELDIWRKTAERIRDYEGEEEKRVKQQLLDYINALELKRAQEAAGASSSSSSSPQNQQQSNQQQQQQQHAVTELGDASSSALLPGHGTDIDNEQTGVIDIAELERRYRINDMPLFLKTVTVLLCVVFLFFIQSFVSLNLSLPWIAILGAFVLLVASGIHDIQRVLEKIELDTMLFFAGLFVLIHGLEKLGVMEFVAKTTTELIENVPEGRSRLAVAVVLIIWVGAMVGAFVDTIPFTKAMLPIVNELGSSPHLGLPLTPLVWALSYGCCFGGNGTLIAASANIVAVGIAEQQGYSISFLRFLKIGMPTTLLSIIVATIYMLIFHVLIPWY